MVELVGQTVSLMNEFTATPEMDSSTGMSYLQNQIKHKNLCLKLEKVNKSGGTRNKTPILWLQHFCVYQTTKIIYGE